MTELPARRTDPRREGGRTSTATWPTVQRRSATWTSTAPPAATTRTLLALMQGLQVVARAEVDPNRLVDAVLALH
jgi:hypothetical protein